MSLSTSTSYSPTVLGVGGRGIVLTKPFECINPSSSRTQRKSSSSNTKTKNRRNSPTPKDKEIVIKLSFGDHAVREYGFMKELPQGKKYPYAQIRDIDLCQVKMCDSTMKKLKKLKEKGAVSQEWIDDFIESQDNIWQLFMPRLGNRSVLEILTSKQMPSFYRGVFLKNSRSKLNANYLSVKQLCHLFHHFSSLLKIIFELNERNLFHHDLKPNNIMCDVDKKGHISKMWLIDFDNSKGVVTNRPSWVFEAKNQDTIDFFNNVVLLSLYVACSNKEIHDNLYFLIEKVNVFCHEIRNEENWLNLKTKASSLMDQIIDTAENMEEPTRNEYIDVALYAAKIPIAKQRENGRIFREKNEMGLHDKSLFQTRIF